MWQPLAEPRLSVPGYLVLVGGGNRIPVQNGVGEKDIVLPVLAVNTLALSYYHCLSKGCLDEHKPSH